MFSPMQLCPIPLIGHEWTVLYEPGFSLSSSTISLMPSLSAVLWLEPPGLPSNRNSLAITQPARSSLIRNSVRSPIDLSVSKYYRRYKRMAEDLHDLSEPISNHTLVLNIIRGLNERFTALGLHLHHSNPLPTFLLVWDNLQLEELTMTKMTPTLAVALNVSSGPNRSTSASTTAPPPSKPQQQTISGSGKRGKHGGGNGGGSGGGGGGRSGGEGGPGASSFSSATSDGARNFICWGPIEKLIY
ncbi:hypothetical protein GUJ93_ZPchr0005g14601 [Zizania palustris]|uniref:Uncharacterized protein n=1 Tax=Zizania palustris TaxID=103762 RepID=A0A8J5W0T3_ZIZPA|nr:hypothetical protein GUJ93_ZPchr0005g14601 [Zizania palustris]